MEVEIKNVKKSYRKNKVLKEISLMIKAGECTGIIGANGCGKSTLLKVLAGIEKADILIAVTGSDELNLLCCLIAKRAGNCQTIARVRNPEYSAEIDFVKESLGLAMTINPEYAAAREIAKVLRFPSAIKINTFAKEKWRC